MNWDRVRGARNVARGLLVLGGAMFFAPLFLYLIAPSSGGHFYEPEIATIPTSLLTPALGIAGMLFGLAWMWWIYRAPTKFETPRWRYRDR
jgi:hypothetical protein